MFPHAALRISAVIGFLGVALGAFGAHGFQELLTHHGRVATWDTAVLYHLTHAVLLVFLSGMQRVSAWWLMFAGVLIFSGTLYVLALTNIRWLGAITPIGGLCLIAGWLALAFGKSKTAY